MQNSASSNGDINAKFELDSLNFNRSLYVAAMTSSNGTLRWHVALVEQAPRHRPSVIGTASQNGVTGLICNDSFQRFAIPRSFSKANLNGGRAFDCRNGTGASEQAWAQRIGYHVAPNLRIEPRTFAFDRRIFAQGFQALQRLARTKGLLAAKFSEIGKILPRGGRRDEVGALLNGERSH